jgi:hypothetical protein
MEALSITIFMSAIFGLMIILLTRKPSCTNKIVRINDKNWIVNGNVVSFEENSQISVFRQTLEDCKHYNHYESEKLKHDKLQIFNDYQKTTKAISVNPSLLDSVNEEKLEQIREKYLQYELMCNKLELPCLSIEFYLVKEENPTLCCDLRSLITPLSHLFIYEIHNKETAKYSGDRKKAMEKEFKLKWY